MDGLRELLRVIEPQVTELDDPEKRLERLALAAPLPQHKRSRLKDALLKEVRVETQVDDADTSGQDEESNVASDPEAAVAPADAPDKTEEDQEGATAVEPEQSPEDEEPSADGEGSDLSEFLSEPAVAFRVVQGLAEALMAPRGPMIYGSLLVVAVAAFESALANIRAQHWVLHPSALDAEEKEFSLADLREFETLEDARDALISRRVDNFMSGNLSEWSRWTKKTLKLALEDAALDYSELGENFQRRHIIVHNAGRVSRQYLAKVDFGGNEPPLLGTFLPVGPNYLNRALDQLETAGSLLVLHAWNKWIPEEREIAAGAANIAAYDLLEEGRWEAVERLCARACALDFPAGIELMIRINGWIAAKRVRGIDTIRTEVEAWDASALADRFKLARHALLDELDEVFEMLPGLVENGEVRLIDVASWPLLKEARDDPRCTPLLERFSEQ